MGIQFHETQMGARFFNQQLPDLIKAINRLADVMEASKVEPCAEHKTTVGTNDPSKKDMPTVNNVPKQNTSDNSNFNTNNYNPKAMILHKKLFNENSRQLVCKEKIKSTDTPVQSPCVNCTSKECGFIDGNECDRFNAWYKRKKELEAASQPNMFDLLNYLFGENNN